MRVREEPMWLGCQAREPTAFDENARQVDERLGLGSGSGMANPPSNPRGMRADALNHTPHLRHDAAARAANVA